MKILLIALEPPMRTDSVVTGNAIRVRQLTTCLQQAGHEVIHAWKEDSQSRPDLGFRDGDELRDLLMRHPVDVHLVCYWELLDLMPFGSETPLVLDFLAPRPLETLFENPARLRPDMRRLIVNLSKVDLVLTGNEMQKSMMTLPLLESGIDLSRDDSIVVVPLAAEAAGRPLSDPGRDGWNLVSGGVNWPWRDAGDYWRAVETLPEWENGSLRLTLFRGAYSYDDRFSEPVGHPVDCKPLLPYREFSDWLMQHGHIGLELAEENIERRHSQSFRSMEFLRHGLPLICNRYLPLAPRIEQYDAGWLIDDPGELPDLLRAIMADPATWRAKSANALRLVEQELASDRTCKPLLEWLETPHKTARLPAEPAAPAELERPPFWQRVKKLLTLQFRSVITPATHKWLFGGHRDKGVVIVTRGDLFPTDHGAAVKIVETARGLSKLGLPVAVVTDDRKRWWKFEGGTARACRVPLWIRALSMPGILARISHYSKNIPMENAFLYLPLSDNSFFWRTLYAGRQVGARVLQAEFPAYVRPCVSARNVLEASVVLVEHNVEYERIRAQVGDITDEQYLRYKAIEIDLCNQCDAVICVSDNDRQKLASDGVHAECLHTVPHGVDLEQFDLPAQPGLRAQFGIPPDAPLLVYHGTFLYPPNLQALKQFSSEILPRLDRLGFECHVLAIGRKLPQQEQRSRIHLAGSVEQIGPWLKAADLAVVPLLEGGGTRMKIIDYFAAGVPVVSTSKGIEGIPVINGRHALVIDDWDAMARGIADLLSDPGRAHALAGAARHMAESMDWTAIARRYVDIFDAIDARAPVESG